MAPFDANATALAAIGAAQAPDGSFPPGQDWFVRTALSRAGDRPRRPDPRSAGVRAEVRRWVAWFGESERNLGGRIALVRFVLDTLKRPPSRWEAALAALRSDHAGLARQILRRALVDPGLVSRLQMATVRFDDAAQAAREARAWLEAAREAGAPGSGAEQPAAGIQPPVAFDVSRLRGKLFLLTNLPALFRTDPPLNAVFPFESADAGAPFRAARTAPLAPSRGTTGLPPGHARSSGPGGQPGPLGPGGPARKATTPPRGAPRRSPATPAGTRPLGPVNTTRRESRFSLAELLFGDRNPSGQELPPPASSKSTCSR